ncbi:MAG: glutathione S-transferase family protein [Alphaproteobacteria bacterium]
MEFHSPAHFAVQPFGKMPALRHGELRLHETLAIGVYVDKAFEGPALQPEGAAPLAQMFKWISSINDCGYTSLIKQLVIPRLISPMRGLEPDEEAIEAGRATREVFLEQAEAALADTEFLAGNTLSLADLFLAPIVASVMRTPEGQAMVPKYKALARWFEAISARPSFAAAHPPPEQPAAG